MPGITPPLLTPGGRRLPPLGLSPGSHISIPATPGGTLWNSLLNATNTDSQTQAPGVAGASGAQTMPQGQHPPQPDTVSVSMHPHPHQQVPSGQPYSHQSQDRSHGVPPQVVGQAPLPQVAHPGSVQPQQPQHQQHQQPQQPQHQHQQPQNPQAPHISLHPGQSQTQANYGQYGNNNARKSGLTPNESNLRSGLTPSGNQQNNGNVFAFNNQLSGFTSNGLINSPMTPGLSSLLGLSHNEAHNQGQGPTLSAVQNQGNLVGHLHNNGQPLQLQVAQSGQLHHQLPHIQGHDTQQQTSQVQRTPPTPPLPSHSRVHDDDAEEVDEKGKRKANGSSKEGTKKQKSNRGRKPKAKEPSVESAIKKESTVNSPMLADDKDKDLDSKKKPTEEERRKHFLERNRLAASKCRQRKKQMAAKMEDELKFFSSAYKDLTGEVMQLRDQLMSYRNIFADHKSCPMLLSHVGGYNQFDDMLQQTDYVLQTTKKDQNALNPGPTSIETALAHGASNHDIDSSMGNEISHTDNNSSTSNPNTNVSNNDSYDAYGAPVAPTSTAHHNLPMTDPHAVANSGATSASSIPNGYGTVPGSANVSTHHSMTDLPAAAAAAAMAGNTSSVPPQSTSNVQNAAVNNINQPQASDLRAINSMTNLEALNHDTSFGLSNNDGQNQANNQGNNINLRAVNSMIDLHQISNHQNNLVNLHNN